MGMNSGLLWADAPCGSRQSTAVAAMAAAIRPDVRPHMRSSPGACPGKVGTGFPARTCANARKRVVSHLGVKDAGGQGPACHGPRIRDELMSRLGASMSSSQERSSAQTFVERHALWNGEQFEAAAKAERLIESEGLEVVRLS